MITANELRIGNLLQYKSGQMFSVTPNDIVKISEWKVIELLPDPITLTEENILKLRYVQRPDFAPLCFSMTPPGDRQIENNFWSTWIHEDYRLHLSPWYDYRRIDREKMQSCPPPTFWFCWYSSVQWFLPIQPIRGNTLRYIHQLQNLWYALTNK